MENLLKGLEGYLYSGEQYKNLYYSMKSYITTGSKDLDRLLDYGIEAYSKYLFYGEAGSGKTIISHQILANCFKNIDYKDTYAVYIDTEGNFSPKLLSTMYGSEDILGRVYVKKVYEYNTLVNLLEKIPYTFNEIGIVIIDNLNDPLASISLSPSMLHILLRKIIFLLNTIKEKFSCPIIITARVLSRPHVFSVDYIKPKGGIALISMVNKAIHLSYIEKNYRKALRENYKKPAAIFKITERGIEDV